MERLTPKEVIIYAYNAGYMVDNEGNFISKTGKIRKTELTSDGRYKVSIRINGKIYHVPIHRLMAYQKFGDRMFDADCVRHLDGNPLNNSYDNIEIGSFSDNMMDMSPDVRIKKARYATSFVTKYNDDKAKVIIEYYNKNHSYKKTMEKFSITSKGTLFYILNKKKTVNPPIRT